MIRNEKEYRQAVERIEREKKMISNHRKQLKSEGLSSKEIKRLTDPVLSFHKQLIEEVQSYQRLMRGEFDEVRNLQGLGRLLIGLRIALGLSQRELATRLDINESQISRDERNEYHGITLDRAQKILDAMEVTLTTSVADAPDAAA